jgi:hypothetical protein
MKRINTSFAVDPYIQQPFTVKSLDFLQNANKEVIAGICVNLIDNTGRGYSETIPYLITSIPIPSTIFSNYYIFFNGELYVAPDNTGALLYAKINVTPDATSDPLLFTDSINRNVHENRYLEFTNTLVGSLFPVAGITDIRLKVSTSITPLLNSWTNYLTGPKRHKYRKDMITLSGAVQKSGAVGSTLIHTLPIGFRPLETSVFICYLNDSGTVKNCAVQIDTGGDIVIDPTNILGSTNTIVFLDGISYFI